jgi:hypothetical protein
MRVFLVLIFLISYFGSAQITPSNAANETTEQMVHACRKIQYVDINPDGTVTGLSNDFDTGHCWGAISAVEALTELLREQGKICGGASTRTQSVAIFMEYAKRHPERYNQLFTAVGVDSMREAFPCKTRSK